MCLLGCLPEWALIETRVTSETSLSAIWLGSVDPVDPLCQGVVTVKVDDLEAVILIRLGYRDLLQVPKCSCRNENSTCTTLGYKNKEAVFPLLGLELRDSLHDRGEQNKISYHTVTCIIINRSCVAKHREIGTTISSATPLDVESKNNALTFRLNMEM
jgi:hypothetical protein